MCVCVRIITRPVRPGQRFEIVNELENCLMPCGRAVYHYEITMYTKLAAAAHTHILMLPHVRACVGGAAGCARVTAHARLTSMHNLVFAMGGRREAGERERSHMCRRTRTPEKDEGPRARARGRRIIETLQSNRIQYTHTHTCGHTYVLLLVLL